MANCRGAYGVKKVEVMHVRTFRMSLNTSISVTTKHTIIVERDALQSTKVRLILNSGVASGCFGA